MSESVAIRHASASDTVALSELAERTFRAAFEADNALADMEAYVRDAFSETQVATELANAENTFLLATLGEEDRLVGYAKLRACEPSPEVASSSPVELHRLYVAPEAIGRGVGAALMQACLDVAQAGGLDTLWLGVWEKNTRAIAFYQKWGFEVVGEHAFTLGSDVQTDLVMQCAVVS